MYQLKIEISEQVYDAISKEAVEFGYSVEEVAAARLERHYLEVSEEELMVCFFTPELLAELDADREQAKSEPTYTLDEIRQMRLNP